MLMTQTLDQPFLRLFKMSNGQNFKNLLKTVFFPEKVKSPMKEQINAKQGRESEAQRNNQNNAMNTNYGYLLLKMIYKSHEFEQMKP